jgi:hypothetical protein
MKKSVMDRPMFKGKNREEIDVENVGIMSGFYGRRHGPRGVVV